MKVYVKRDADGNRDAAMRARAVRARAKAAQLRVVIEINGHAAFDRGYTSVNDLETLFGRTLYHWEHDLWTIAGWTGSRRYFNV